MQTFALEKTGYSCAVKLGYFTSIPNMHVANSTFHREPPPKAELVFLRFLRWKQV